MDDQSFLSVYFIDGPPASGKTSLIRLIGTHIFHQRLSTAAIVKEGFMFLISDYEPNSPEYSLEWVDNRMEVILQLLEEGKTHIFVDSSPWLAIAYHPEIDESEIEERLGRLGGFNVNFWSLNTPWSSVQERLVSRLHMVSKCERRRRINLREQDMDYMKKRHHSVDIYRHKYQVREAHYHLLTLAKSVLR